MSEYWLTSKFPIAATLVVLACAGVPSVASAESFTESEAVNELIRLSGRIERDEKLPGHPVVAIAFTSGSEIRDRDLYLLTSIKELRNLSFYENKITDSGMQEIGKLKNLTHLTIAHLGMTDAGLKEIKQLTKLQDLNLSGTRIAGTRLGELQELKY